MKDLGSDSNKLLTAIALSLHLFNDMSQLTELMNGFPQYNAKSTIAKLIHYNNNHIIWLSNVVIK